MTEWRECKLSDVMEIIGGGTPKTSVPEYWNGNIPWLSVADFNNGNRYVYDAEKRITELGLKNSSTKILKKGQLIISARGTVGAIAQLGRDMAFNQSCYGLTANSLSTNDFLFYLLKQCIVELKQQSNGGVFDTIIRETFDNINISLPPLPEQKAIAEVLSSLDDKIDLLTRQNKTLEDLAQAYFRKWFIEDASDEWETDILGNYADITRGASPRPIIKYVENGTFPWVKIGDATSSSSMFIYETKEKITEEGISKSVIAYKGEIILSNSATCGFPYIMGIDGCIHDGWLLFRNYRRLTKWYIYFLLRSMYREIIIQADGTVQDNLNTNILKNLQITIPEEKLIKTFDTFAESCIQKISQNDAQIRTLSKLRDTLLPKLISGEIRVKM